MSLSSHQSSRSQTCDWLTPPEWIKALGPFEIDPCASVDQPWRTAQIQWTVGSDGLTRPWPGFVWLNPPYGPPSVINPWIEKLACYNHGIACIPARTETKLWFKEIWPKARSVLFVEGRPHFHRPITGERAKANSGAPIALIAYGNKAHERLVASGIKGKLIEL